jgi:DNA-binding FrmR family transcriptional regulator
VLSALQAAGPDQAGSLEQGEISCVPGFVMNIQKEEQKRLLQNRINRLEGQLRGISRMIGEERECGEVLQQLSAARSALQGTIEVFLEDMVRNCLLEDGVDVETRRKLAGEMLAIVRKV